MTRTATSVRPAIRRLAITACVILLPVAAHSVWDYIEVRRLVDEIEAIKARGEPVSEREALGHDRPIQDRGAASYYLAGAMLALGNNPWPATAPVYEWLAGPVPNREALHGVAATARDVVQKSTDALQLVDKAGSLRFDSFPAGTEFTYRTAGVGALSEVINARTLSLSESGDAGGAVASTISCLQIRRALRDAGWPAHSDCQVAAVLSLTRPSRDVLDRLQAALEAEDQPDQPRQNFLRERAQYVELIWRAYYGADPSTPAVYMLPVRSLMETIARPWFTHNVVDLLRLWARLAEVLKTPWPDKVRRSADVLENQPTEFRRFGLGPPFFPLLARGFPVDKFLAAVDPTEFTVDRCSRVAVSVERYRRDRNRLPAALLELVPEYLHVVPDDPFSGRPLLFRPVNGAYIIYSVGPNQRDDVGDLFSQPKTADALAWGSRVIRGADVGVRVLTSN